MNQYATMTLNSKQRELLALIAKASDSGERSGAVVYGRGYTETVAALERRGLVQKVGAMILVASMGKLETRHRWMLTDLGWSVTR